ncbi:HET-E1 [Symbiodinium natans]|uniref:HET-E1 protein n=1 Tax=Symbiodinium natans TaxID=878477 RepID=A0A812LXB2_9DINO|nr:HET-E1 [Symbiodinium natans]
MANDDLTLLLEGDRRSMFPGCNPRMITVSTDQTMRQWDVKTGDEKRCWWRHKAAILCLSVDWDTDMAVTGSGDHSLALWDVNDEVPDDKALQCFYRGHKDWVTSVDVDWDGRRILSGAADGEVRIWDFDAEESVATLSDHTGAVCSVAAEWDLMRAISVGQDQIVRSWDLETGRCISRLEGHTGAVWCCSLGPDGNKAVTGAFDRHLMVWDLRSKSCVRAMLQHGRQVVDLRVDWPTFQGMSCSADRSIILWDLEVAEPLQKFEKHPGSVWCMDVDWAGRRMVTGAGPGDNSLFVWDFRDGFVERQILGHEGSVWALAVDWEVAHKAFETAQGVGLQTEAAEEPPDSHVPSKEEQSGEESPEGKVALKGKRRKKWVKQKLRPWTPVGDHFAAAAQGTRRLPSDELTEHHQSLLFIDAFIVMPPAKECPPSACVMCPIDSTVSCLQPVPPDQFGEDLQQLGEGLHTLHGSVEAAAFDQLTERVSEVQALLGREMATLTRVEDQLEELRAEVAAPRPGMIEQQQDSLRVSRLLQQERARAAAARLRNLVSPPFKEIGSLHVAFTLWKLQSRRRVAFESSLAYRKKISERADLQAVVTAWRSMSRPSMDRMLDSELKDLPPT